ncbi:hypothetical protein BDZ85DRAFT_261049 [Elsinoe ampelina]|uniref:Uncharacterized protein n=1 Tax=Elsinoe ampelina TaxID=302913 RepID=A0A6A6GFH2_9PEZI|nr:hypothetical protein BDZ85DRAFT_261049 [Elsinoe ampelina]
MESARRLQSSLLLVQLQLAATDFSVFPLRCLVSKFRLLLQPLLLPVISAFLFHPSMSTLVFAWASSPTGSATLLIQQQSHNPQLPVLSVFQALSSQRRSALASSAMVSASPLSTLQLPPLSISWSPLTQQLLQPFQPKFLPVSPPSLLLQLLLSPELQPSLPPQEPSRPSFPMQAGSSHQHP